MGDPQARLEIITHQLEEVVGAEDILKILKDGGDPSIYWGTATTGKPHFGYFVPMLKVADFLKAGCHVTILFADLHAYLDNMKSNWELLHKRCAWYELVIKEMLKLVGVPLEKLQFVKGTDYQLTREYTLDVYKMSALVTTEATTRAGAEVVKQTEHPLMSNLLYPILQALDEEYLKFGGTDQRKIFMFARENLPRVGYRKRAHLMNPLIPGLGESGKMSSSEPNSKIDFDDTPKQVQDKLKRAFSVDGKPESSGMMAILKFVLFRFLEVHGRPFRVPRPADHGGDVEYANYEAVETAFREKQLWSNDLKPAVASLINEFIAPLREVIAANAQLMREAYPPVVQISGIDLSKADIRVGRVLSVEKHPDADTLYVESIDCGAEKPLTIVSGLAKAMAPEALKDRLVPVVCNLPPAVLKGVTSEGMVLVAQTVDRPPVLSLLEVPEGVEPGARLTAPPYAGPAEASLSKSYWTKIAKQLAIVAGGCEFRGVHLVAPNGAQLRASIQQGSIG